MRLGRRLKNSIGFYKNDANGELYYAHATENALCVWLFVLPPICFGKVDFTMTSLDSDAEEEFDGYVVIALVNPMKPTLLWSSPTEEMADPKHDFPLPENYRKVDVPVSHGGYIYKTIFPEYMRNEENSAIEFANGILQRGENFWVIFRHEQYEIPADGDTVVVRQAESGGQEQAVLSIFPDGSFSKP